MVELGEKDRRLMFVVGRWGVGGVERVTATLATEFARRGWHVVVVAFSIADRTFLKDIDSRVVVEELRLPAFCLRNLRRLRLLIRLHGIRFVINQWAMPFYVSLLLRLAKTRRTALIAFHHTTPNRSNRIERARGVRRQLMTFVARTSFRWTYRLSDAYLVLVESYKKAFLEFTGISDESKLGSMPNPIRSYSASDEEKENLIVYVGRLDPIVKRSDRVVDVWREIADQLPDWRLQVVGDGPGYRQMSANAVHLPRIEFCGFQNPADYYRRAKILILTSEYEGFPAVLLEALSARCVPVVSGGFLSAYDLLANGAGVIVPPPWDTKSFGQAVVKLAVDESRRLEMVVRGTGLALDYSSEAVVDRFVNFLKTVER